VLGFLLKGENMASIKILKVLLGEVGIPRNDGIPGSALYAVPFQISGVPSSIWVDLFIQNWDHPPRFTSMHRPGIARVIGDRIILDGTTIEEVEKYHQTTLKEVVEFVNKLAEDYEKELRRGGEEREASEQKHRKNVQDISKNIKFD
jgi:hypothetical protein